MPEAGSVVLIKIFYQSYNVFAPGFQTSPRIRLEVCLDLEQKLKTQPCLGGEELLPRTRQGSGPCRLRRWGLIFGLAPAVRFLVDFAELLPRTHQGSGPCRRRSWGLIFGLGPAVRFLVEFAE